MEQTQALIKSFPCDEELRGRLLALRESGDVTNSKIAKGACISDAIVSQYLNPAGNIYPGEIAKYERHLAGWLDRREMETLAGIPTIPTAVSEQIASAAKMIRRCGIMGKGIGKAGIGKTRGAALLASTDPGSLLRTVSRETGTRESIRSGLFRALGIRGPRKRTAARARGSPRCCSRRSITARCRRSAPRSRYCRF